MLKSHQFQGNLLLCNPVALRWRSPHARPIHTQNLLRGRFEKLTPLFIKNLSFFFQVFCQQKTICALVPCTHSAHGT